MPSRNFWLSFLLVFGFWGVSAPAWGQALLPHTLQIDSSQLEKQGLGLAQEAAQLAQFQQYELALPRARLATQLAPKTYQPWFLLGGLYLQTKKLDEALPPLQRAQSLDPKNPAILFTIGSTYFQQQKYGEAVKNLQAGLRIKPDDAEALFDLGNAHYKLGQFPEAIAQYEKASTLPSWEKWPAINNIGLIKYEQGDVLGAIKQWESALSIGKKAAEPQLAMAVALYSRGDTQKGITMAEAALRTDRRYSDLNFLKENLWGDRLLADTKKLLAAPRIQAVLKEPQPQPPQVRVAPQSP